MLSVWEAIQVRRSIRRFAPDDVPEEMIKQMLEAARLAPSGSNRQPWRFLVVRDKELKRQLGHVCLDQRFVTEAPVVIVCFGDLNAYSMEARRKRNEELEPAIGAERSGRFADAEYRAYLESLPVPPRGQLLRPLTANSFIAIEHLVLMATALGLGTCWVGGFTHAIEINRLFGLPNNLVVVAVVPVGYPVGKIPPPRPRLPLEEIILKSPVTGTEKQA
ncbi:MAG: nitroreductase family protein [Chloroflexota bacterium]